MKVAVVMNAGAGSIGKAAAEERAEAIRAAFAAASVEATILACEGARLTSTARNAARDGADVVVAAGGDGTVSAVAAGLIGGDVPMAVLPLGTLNHFAKDLGMPLVLEEAAAAIAAGRVARVDAGEVNGRVFVNNSSIGLYPEMVVSREAEQKKRGIGKWRAMAIAAWRVLRRFPLLVVHVLAGGRALVTRTPLVFVGCNAYQLSPIGLGQRARLDGGALQLYLLRCRGRWKMFRLMLRAILQQPERVEDFECEPASELRIDVRKRRVRVALDGEVVTMAPPLEYRLREAALPVIVPPGSTAVEPVEPVAPVAPPAASPASEEAA